MWSVGLWFGKWIKIAVTDSTNRPPQAPWATDVCAVWQQTPCLAGQRPPSFGKAGLPGKLSPTLVISFSGPHSLYTQFQKFPSRLTSRPSMDVTQWGAPCPPRPMHLLLVLGLCVLGSGSFIAFNCQSPGEVTQTPTWRRGLLCLQPPLLPECWLNLQVCDPLSSGSVKLLFLFLNPSRPGALRMQIGLWEKDSSQ